MASGTTSYSLDEVGNLISIKVLRADPQYAWYVAECYALVECPEESVQWLEHAVARGLINHPLLARLDPTLATVRRETGFLRLMRKVHDKWQSFQS